MFALDATRTDDDGPTPSPASLTLWRLHGATDRLRGLLIATSFGHAFGLELDDELLLLHLLPSLEALVEYSDRIEAALLAQGWQRHATPLITHTRRSVHDVE